MRVLKNILIGFGVLFVLVIAFISWIGVSSSHFRKAQTPFVETFFTDLSKHWDIADVYDRLEAPIIEQAETPHGQDLLRQFKKLGALRSVRDLELRSFKANNRTRTGSFSFKGAFENGEAVVNVIVVERDATVRVFGFSLRGVVMRHEASKLKT